jgi:hypothetical protein
MRRVGNRPRPTLLTLPVVLAVLLSLRANDGGRLSEVGEAGLVVVGILDAEAGGEIGGEKRRWTRLEFRDGVLLEDVEGGDRNGGETIPSPVLGPVVRIGLRDRPRPPLAFGLIIRAGLSDRGEGPGSGEEAGDAGELVGEESGERGEFGRG